MLFGKGECGRRGSGCAANSHFAFSVIRNVERPVSAAIACKMRIYLPPKGEEEGNDRGEASREEKQGPSGDLACKMRICLPPGGEEGGNGRGEALVGKGSKPSNAVR